MPSRYDERDFDRYDERTEDTHGRHDADDYERNRYERGGAYDRNAGRGAERSTGGRDYETEDYRSSNYGRGARRFDYEREGTYETDYRAPADRDYGRARNYERDREDSAGRTYGRAGERGRDYGRDYYDTRGPRAYDYNRRERDYAPRGYDYDEERGDWALRRPRRADDVRARAYREPRGRDFARGKDRSWWDRVSDEVASWFGDEQAERRRLHDEARGGGATHHRGRGPRGYRRSDERIREDINDRLTDHPYIDASDIEVTVNNGEVKLNGVVESRQAKRLAEDIAESVSGVTDVENRLRINRAAAETIEPSELPTPATAMTPADTTGATPTTTETPGTNTTDTAETTRVRATSAGATGEGRTKPKA